MKNKIKDDKELVLFENSKIRRCEYNGEWYYSIVDIVQVLTDQKKDETARKYWNKLKQRLIIEENDELETFCHQLKLPSKKDGKNYKTDCGNRETIFRIIQSVPSPNASRYIFCVAGNTITLMPFLTFLPLRISAAL